MRTITFGDLIAGRADGLPSAVYVVRAGRDVLYAGMSITPTRRLWNHIGKHPGGNSDLGILFRENEPGSRRWRIDLYEGPDWGDLSAPSFELRKIRELRPYLNAEHNAEPPELPVHYRQRALQTIRSIRRMPDPLARLSETPPPETPPTRPLAVWP